MESSTSKAHSSYFDSLCTPNPHYTILKSSWWSLFCPPAPRQQHQRSAGCKMQSAWKTKQNWKIKKSPRGWEIFMAAKWNGKKLLCTEEGGRKKELPYLIVYFSDFNHCLQRIKKSVGWVTRINYNNKQMRKWLILFCETMMTCSLCQIIKAH